MCAEYGFKNDDGPFNPKHRLLSSINANPRPFPYLKKHCVHEVFLFCFVFVARIKTWQGRCMYLNAGLLAVDTEMTKDFTGVP